MEVRFQDDWMEVLGCGVMEQELLNSGQNSHMHALSLSLSLNRQVDHFNRGFDTEQNTPDKSQF